MNKIHYHTDTESLAGNFVDTIGNALNVLNLTNIVGYFMQNENIVFIAYTHKQAIKFNDEYNGEKLNPIYFYINAKNR